MHFIVEQRPKTMSSIGSSKGNGIDGIVGIEGVLEEKWKCWLNWPTAKYQIPEGLDNLLETFLSVINANKIPRPQIW